MTNRPLCSICLIVSAIWCISICLGGKYFLKELRPSQAEKHFQTGDKVCLIGKVYEKTEKADYQILYLKQISIRYQQHSLKESKIILYDNNKLKIKIGDVLEVDGDIRFFESATNPGNFDQKLYYQRQNIHGEVWGENILIRRDGSQTKYEYVKEKLYCFRKLWKTMLYESMDEKSANTLSAMLLGEKSQMDQEVRELYQVNGIGHILAISGLHLTFIGVGIYEILRRMSGSFFLGGMFGVLFLGLYVGMVGVTVSVFRAFVMFLFRVGADLTGRNYDCVTALSVSAMLLLFWRPLSVFDGGFWLSFGAVLALLFLFPAFRDFPLQGVWVSVSVSVFLVPIVLVQFFEIPLFSTVLNIIVLPLFSLMLTMAITGSILGGLFRPAGGFLLKGTSWILRGYDVMCRLALKIPGARIVPGKPEKWQVFFYYFCLVGMLVFYHNYKKKKRGKKWLPFLVGGFGLFVLFFPFGKIGNLTITVMDVGQGDGIFIRGPYGGTYLIDGGSSDVKNVGKYRIETFLKSQGVKKLDYVFVSHGDSDHINGISEMLERQILGIEIQTLVFPRQSVWDDHLKKLAKKAEENGTACVQMKEGQTLREGKLSLKYMLPEQGVEYESENEASMVLHLSYQGFDFLFTGDVEGRAEERLTELLEEENNIYEILKAAHHGSKSSTGKEFLQIVKPRYTIISAGKNNRYGHPHQETLKRLEEVNSQVYSTAVSGALIVRVKRNGNYFIRRYIS